ncbi:hypothetical protein ACO0R3_003959 [Hanseniaspora guilliermondii]
MWGEDNNMNYIENHTNTNLYFHQDQVIDSHNLNGDDKLNDDGLKNGKTRTRIPREILDVFLQEFKKNISPSSEDRKRIAEQCNIEEKKVRIWFQNKRAKLKKIQNKMNNQNTNQQNLSYENQQHNANGYPNQMNYFNNENVHNDQGQFMMDDELDMDSIFDNVPWGLNKNYHFIDSSSVSVGGWKRVKNGHLLDTVNEEHGDTCAKTMELVENLSNLSPKSIDSIMGDSTDLLLIISNKNNEINYFFSAIADGKKILFRVFFPIYSVANCSISVSKDAINCNGKDSEDDEELSQLSLMLNRPPKFAVYFTEGEDGDNQWNICDDFSEDKQVSMSFIGSYEIPHIITGLEDSLKRMNSLILEYNSKIGVIYHVPSNNSMQNLQGNNPIPYSLQNDQINLMSNQSQNKLHPEQSITQTPLFFNKVSHVPDLLLNDNNILKKNIMSPFATNSEAAFSPTPSNAMSFLQFPGTPNFFNASNTNNAGMNQPFNPLKAYVENQQPTNSLNLQMLETNDNNESVNLMDEPNQQSNDKDNDDMKNSLYIDSILDLS